MNVKLNVFQGDRASEIFQSMDIKFAFVVKSGENEFNQQHLAIKCRDFLGDVLWSKKTGLNASIYGFSYNYQTKPYDDSKLLLSLKFPNQEAMDNFINNLPNLHAKEKLAGTEESQVLTTDQPLTIILLSDKLWQSNVWKLSLFTFYLKLISYKSVADCKSPEDRYLMVLNNGVEDKYLSKIKTFFDEVTSTDICTAHNNSGFVSIAKGINGEMHKMLLGA